MQAYFSVWSARFRTLLQYRAAAVAGFGTQLFWGLIRVMVFTAFYQSSSVPPPIALPDMITYLWLIQAMFALTMWNIDQDVREMIRTGTVAYEMLRPLDLYGLWYSRAMAARVAPTLLRAVPMFVVALPFLGMQLPPTFAAGFAWVVATFGAILLTAAFSTLVTIVQLYTIAADGIARIAPILTYTLSGMLIPLPLLPEALQPIFNFLPFRSMIDTPFRLYTGHIPAMQLPAVLAHQLGWTMAFVLFGRWLLARATQRLVIQGG
jgi:ABC-2 type transport system permease protein